MAVTANTSIAMLRDMGTGQNSTDCIRRFPLASKRDTLCATSRHRLEHASLRISSSSNTSLVFSQSKDHSNMNTHFSIEHRLGAGRTPFRNVSSDKNAVFNGKALYYSRRRHQCPLCASNSSNGSAISHVPNTVAPAGRRDSDAVPSSNGRATWQDRAHPIASAAGDREASGSAGEDPYRIVGGRKIFVDELDVVGFLDGYEQLRSIDPESYNPAVYLWKKLEAIPEERQHRLLSILQPRHFGRMWAVAGSKFDDVDLLPQDATDLLPDGMMGVALKPEVWEGRITGRSPALRGVSDKIAPLYFRVVPFYEERGGEGEREAYDAVFKFEGGEVQPNGMGGQPEGYPALGNGGMGWYGMGWDGMGWDGGRGGE